MREFCLGKKTKIMNGYPKFYSYLWLREDGTPYYVGKGQRDRAFIREGHSCYPPPDKLRILIFPMVDEQEAFESEIALIDLFGRRNIGTGCLRNFTSGGEGTSGRPVSEETRKRMHDALVGRYVAPPCTQEIREKISLALKGRPKSAEHRAKTKQACKNSFPEVRQKISNTHKGMTASQETRQKMSAAQKLRHQREREEKQRILFKV